MGCNCSSLQGSGNCPHFPDQQNGTWLPANDNSRKQWGLSPSSQSSASQVQKGTQLKTLTSLVRGGQKNAMMPDEPVSIKDMLVMRDEVTSSTPDDQEQYQHLKSLLRGAGQPMVNSLYSCNIHHEEVQECSTESLVADSEAATEKEWLEKWQNENHQKTTLEKNSTTWDGVEYVTNDHFFSGISNDLWPGEPEPQAAQCTMNRLTSPVTVHSDESTCQSSPRSDPDFWQPSLAGSSLEEQNVLNMSLDGLLRKVLQDNVAENASLPELSDGLDSLMDLGGIDTDIDCEGFLSALKWYNEQSGIVSTHLEATDMLEDQAIQETLDAENEAGLLAILNESFDSMDSPLGIVGLDQLGQSDGELSSPDSTTGPRRDDRETSLLKKLLLTPPNTPMGYSREPIKLEDVLLHRKNQLAKLASSSKTETAFPFNTPANSLSPRTNDSASDSTPSSPCKHSDGVSTGVHEHENGHKHPELEKLLLSGEAVLEAPLPRRRRASGHEIGIEATDVTNLLEQFEEKAEGPPKKANGRMPYLRPNLQASSKLAALVTANGMSLDKSRRTTDRLRALISSTRKGAILTDPLPKKSRNYQSSSKSSKGKNVDHLKNPKSPKSVKSKGKKVVSKRRRTSCDSQKSRSDDSGTDSRSSDSLPQLSVSSDLKNGDSALFLDHDYCHSYLVQQVQGDTRCRCRNRSQPQESGHKPDTTGDANTGPEGQSLLQDMCVPIAECTPEKNTEGEDLPSLQGLLEKVKEENSDTQSTVDQEANVSETTSQVDKDTKQSVDAVEPDAEKTQEELEAEMEEGELPESDEEPGFFSKLPPYISSGKIMPTPTASRENSRPSSPVEAQPAATASNEQEKEEDGSFISRLPGYMESGKVFIPPEANKENSKADSLAHESDMDISEEEEEDAEHYSRLPEYYQPTAGKSRTCSPSSDREDGRRRKSSTDRRRSCRTKDVLKENSKHRSRSHSRSRSRSHSYSRSHSRSHSRSSRRSRTRSCSRSRSRSRSPYWSRSHPRHSSRLRRSKRSSHDEREYLRQEQLRKQREQEMKLEEKKKKIEERRVVYVGKIRVGTTKGDLRRRFQRFGPIEEVSVHFRDAGDNYGFVTFKYTCDAFAAIEEGNQDLGPREAVYDLCFGGRRQFCQTDYADLDSYHGSLSTDRQGGRSNGGRYDTMDYGELLRQAQKKSSRGKR
ncbi:PREDICTED: peroxisome proliferator-activated receptor gamma coactivator 1-alpha-like isoform X2 [Branchiostoma belcheri]|uniref:Peroxisome proliferator-activated receptor gamma coactivator 1-alpha-like isoform X2 n=1 Tax=Branchiostoma belcheri TaxID=7741 RepID=A0A6P5A476_BRABE|nr:PREDICTED: peroxisome proliferator-activated receptor gamma coactivator 1-alpha-like isoform X2 [Branchiostoma belcheri]